MVRKGGMTAGRGSKKVLESHNDRARIPDPALTEVCDSHGDDYSQACKPINVESYRWRGPARQWPFPV